MKQRTENISALKIEMLPNPNQQLPGAASPGLQLQPAEALKPSFSLSLDNYQTELSTWLSQSKSYVEASRLHTVPVDQQQEVSMPSCKNLLLQQISTTLR